MKDETLMTDDIFFTESEWNEGVCVISYDLLTSNFILPDSVAFGLSKRRCGSGEDVDLPSRNSNQYS
jgi:hypothetical protein